MVALQRRGRLMAISDDALSTFALRAFRLGLTHGRTNVSGEMLDSDDVLTEVQFPITRLEIHRHAIWQVYSAGFIMGKAT